MSNEIQVATIALPFRSSLTTFDTDSRIAELSEKVCCAPKELLYIFFDFFKWLLELARSVYQNNSYGKCVTKTRSQVPAGEAQLQQLLYLLSVYFTDAPDSSRN